MKKRLLYIAPDHYDFYKVVLKGFQEYSNHEVVMVLSSGPIFKYKNAGEKVLNFFMKLFLNKNIKKIHSLRSVIEKIDQYDSYDVLYINRPDIFSSEQLAFIAQKAKFSIVHYWDSFEKIKGQQETMPFFDMHYSFDKNDCANYGLHKTSNFYFAETSTNTPEYDVFFLGTYDSRFEKAKQIIDLLNQSGKKAKALILSTDTSLIKKYTSESITFIKKIIPFPESVNYSANTHCILDIHHDNQIGLSFRPFEAMGMRKKLITTNAHIQDYDFYDPDNIFIWTDTTVEIPDSFLNTPYKEIPAEIRKKYSLENWVHTILNTKVTP